MLGIDADKVYGVFLCGARCNDTKAPKRYLNGTRREARCSVGLVELSAPCTIGKFHTTKASTTHFQVTNDTGVWYLASFFLSLTNKYPVME